MDKHRLQIDLHALRLIPAGMMALFAMQSSLAFGSVEMYLQSYILLGLSILSSCFATYVCMRDKFVTQYELYILALIIIVIASSIITPTDYKNWIFVSTGVLTPLFLFRYYNNITTYLLVGALVGFSVSVYIGFADLLSKPELWMSDERGVPVGYLLGGNYNQMGPVFVCALTVNCLCVKISRWYWVNFIPLATVSLAMLFIVNSSTAIFGVILLLLLWSIPTPKLKGLAISGIGIAVMLFEFFVCFQGKGFENNELARWLIIDVLGKDMTFTYRTDMWDSAIRIIIQSPLYGYGYPDAAWYNANMSSLAIGPHNMILGVLVYAGVIGLALYGTIIYTAIKQSIKSGSYIAPTAFAALSVMMLFEVYSMSLVVFLLTLMYNSPNIIKKYQ